MKKILLSLLSIAVIMTLIPAISYMQKENKENRINQNRLTYLNTLSPEINLLDYNKNLYLESDTIVLRLGLNDLNSKVEVKREADNSWKNVNSCAYVDFSKKEMGIYKAHCPGDTHDQILIKKNINIELKENEKYSVYFSKKDGKDVILTLVDDYTNNSVEVISNTVDAGSGWGRRQYSIVKGDITVDEFFDLNTQSNHPIVGIIGDSYVEGRNMPLEKDKRYAYILNKVLKGRVFITARGGAQSHTGYFWLNDYILDTVKPKYMILTLGMNEAGVEHWKEYMNRSIELLKENNIVPVLMTMPPKGNGNPNNKSHMEMNKYIRSCGERYIDAAKALSKHHNGVTYDNRWYLEDKVHPNELGHWLIYKQIVHDLPEIFKTEG